MQSYGYKYLIFSIKNEGLSCLNSHMNSFKVQRHYFLCMKVKEERLGGSLRHDDTPQGKNKIKQKIKQPWQSLEQAKHWVSNYFWIVYPVPHCATGLQDLPGRQLTYLIVANIQYFQFPAVTHPLRQVFQVISMNKEHQEV